MFQFVRRKLFVEKSSVTFATKRKHQRVLEVV